MTKGVLGVLVALSITASLSQVQAQEPRENAALRYWMAFSAMKEPAEGLSGVTTAQLDLVASSLAPWDESTLGKIVDDNSEALGIMQRASRLPSCDWGLEYELGPATPVAHLAKARALARLNGIQAARLLSQGQIERATDVWLASVMFSQHIAKDGTLISLLSARSAALSPSLRSLTALAPRLNQRQRVRVDAVVRSIPLAGFDWADAMQREAEILAATRRLTPMVSASMPSRSRVDQTAAEVTAERQALQKALAAR